MNYKIGYMTEIPRSFKYKNVESKYSDFLVKSSASPTGTTMIMPCLALVSNTR